MDIRENENIELTGNSESVTKLIDDPVSDAEVPEKKKEKKKKPLPRRSAEERRTINLLMCIIAVGLCLLCVSVVGMVGVLGGVNIETATTTQPADANQGVVAPAVTTQAPVQTPNPQGGETPTVSSDGANSANAPQTDEEWLTFFNTAVNKLKTDGPSMTKAKQTKTADIQLSNPLGQAVVSTAKDKYLSDEVVETPIAKGDTSSAVANISPDGASYVSNLTMSDIKAISHTADANGNYVITINMHDLTNPELTSAYGKIFEFMTVDDVMNTYAPDMGATVDRSNVSLVFSNCSVSATISPDGKVVSYQTTVNANMILKDAKISVITTDVDAALFSETKYTNIAW